ncbi:putative carbonyl reductase [Mycena polygramma]|nr:putative carbonyl reductase [Mycena polygramma]
MSSSATGMLASERRRQRPSTRTVYLWSPSHKSIEAAAETVKSKFGRLDVLINNAGIATDNADPSTTVPLLSVRSIFEKTFAVNTFGAAVTTEAFIPLLEKSSAARIVFISSDIGSLGFRADPEGRFNFADFPAYRSSKAALNMIALGYAYRFREKGWKVNMHNPGYTKTDLNHNTGTGTVEDGVKGAVRLATLGADGETATFSEKEGPLPW